MDKVLATSLAQSADRSIHWNCIAGIDCLTNRGDRRGQLSVTFVLLPRESRHRLEALALTFFSTDVHDAASIVKGGIHRERRQGLDLREQ